MTRKQNSKKETPAQNKPASRPAEQQVLANSDKKTPPSWIPIAAFVISIISLLWNGFNQFYQNRRLDTFNSPKVILEDEQTVMFNTITSVAKDTTAWGYLNYLYHTPEDKWMIPYYIELYDSSNNQISGNFGFSHHEIETGLHNKGYFGAYSIFKTYRFGLYLRNIGQTEANDVRITVDVKSPPYPTKPWDSVKKITGAGMTLGPQEKKSISFELTVPGSRNFVDTLYSRVEIRYTDKDGNDYTKRHHFEWRQKDNLWGEFTTSEW